MKPSVLLVLSASLALVCAAPRAQDGAAAFAARIEGAQSPNRQGWDPYTLPELMERFSVPGVSVAVIRDYQIHWTKGYGQSDVSAKTPVTPETMFQAASISKPVTAFAVMRLVEAGKVALDEDVNRYLKSWKVPETEFTRGRPVTLRALLSHTSGTGDGFGFPGYDPSADAGADHQRQQAVKRWSRLLGAASLHRVQVLRWRHRHRPAAADRRRRQAVPRDDAGAGPRSRRHEQQYLRAAAAGRSRREGGTRTRRPRPGNEREMARVPGAGLWTTAGDLAKLAIELQKALRGESKLLSRAAAQEMVTPVGTGPYAVGFSIERRNEGWYFSHGGSNWGFQCDLVGHRLKGYGVAVMTNSDSGGRLIAELEARVAAAYNWDSLDKPVPR